jgi:hypothetical protein
MLGWMLKFVGDNNSMGRRRIFLANCSKFLHKEIAT